MIWKHDHAFTLAWINHLIIAIMSRNSFPPVSLTNVTLFAKTRHKKSQRKSVVSWKRVATRCQCIVNALYFVVNALCHNFNPLCLVVNALCFVVNPLWIALNALCCVVKSLWMLLISLWKSLNLPDYLHHAINFELPMVKNIITSSFHWKVKCCEWSLRGRCFYVI